MATVTRAGRLLMFISGLALVGYGLHRYGVFERRPAGEGGPENGTPRLFTIGYGAKADTASLQRLAEAGGGAFFSGTPRDIRAVYAELATFF